MKKKVRLRRPSKSRYLDLVNHSRDLAFASNRTADGVVTG
jgi:hypothetical protein